MYQKESWGAIAVPMESHSTQRDQPLRMHGPGLRKCMQKEQREQILSNIVQMVASTVKFLFATYYENRLHNYAALQYNSREIAS